MEWIIGLFKYRYLHIYTQNSAAETVRNALERLLLDVGHEVVIDIIERGNASGGQDCRSHDLWRCGRIAPPDWQRGGYPKCELARGSVYRRGSAVDMGGSRGE